MLHASAPVSANCPHIWQKALTEEGLSPPALLSTAWSQGMSTCRNVPVSGCGHPGGAGSLSLCSTGSRGLSKTSLPSPQSGSGCPSRPPSSIQVFSSPSLPPPQHPGPRLPTPQFLGRTATWLQVQFRPGLIITVNSNNSVFPDCSYHRILTVFYSAPSHLPALNVTYFP